MFHIISSWALIIILLYLSSNPANHFQLEVGQLEIIFKAALMKFGTWHPVEASFGDFLHPCSGNVTAWKRKLIDSLSMMSSAFEALLFHFERF